MGKNKNNKKKPPELPTDKPEKVTSAIIQGQDSDLLDKPEPSNESNQSKSGSSTIRRRIKLLLLYLFIPMFCSIMGAFATPIAVNIMDKILNPKNDNHISNIDQLKRDIEKDIDLLRSSINSTKAEESQSNIISTFQSSVYLLSSYLGSYEIAEFPSESLEESYGSANQNISERNTYDSNMKLVLSHMKEIYELDVIKNNPVFVNIEDNSFINKTAQKWIKQDLARNEKVSKNLSYAINKRDSTEFIRALEPFVDLKNDEANYRFHKTFYDHLGIINHLCLSTLNYNDDHE